MSDMDIQLPSVKASFNSLVAAIAVAYGGCECYCFRKPILVL